jgi:hypothetical protein
LAAFVDFISSSPCAATLAGRLGNLSNGLFALAEFCGACGGQESEALFLNLNPAPEAWINPGQGSRLIWNDLSGILQSIQCLRGPQYFPNKSKAIHGILTALK